MTLGKGLAAAVVMMAAMTGTAFGQAGGRGGPGGGGGGPGGGRGNFDPAQVQQMMMDNLKQQLGTSDEDFAAIQPKLEAVITAQRATNSGGRGGRGGGQSGPGGFGGGRGGQNTTPTAVQKALSDLQATLDNTESTPEQIKAKVTAVREAKAAAKASLSKAQDALRELLSQRQEAVLSMMGYLE
jgi:hypothetical protein